MPESCNSLANASYCSCVPTSVRSPEITKWSAPLLSATANARRSFRARPLPSRDRPRLTIFTERLCVPAAGRASSIWTSERCATRRILPPAVGPPTTGNIGYLVGGQRNRGRAGQGKKRRSHRWHLPITERVAPYSIAKLHYRDEGAFFAGPSRRERTHPCVRSSLIMMTQETRKARVSRNCAKKRA